MSKEIHEPTCEKGRDNCADSSKDVVDGMLLLKPLLLHIVNTDILWDIYGICSVGKSTIKKKYIQYYGDSNAQ